MRIGTVAVPGIALLMSITGFVAAVRAGEGATSPAGAGPAASGPASQTRTGPAMHKAGEVVIEQASIDVASGKIDYELGTLYVPENRADPKSRTIGVGFARFKAVAGGDGPPTFHLPGGPGTSFLTNLKGYAGHALRYRTAGDVVLMDQRGFSKRGDVLTYAVRTPELPLDEPASLAKSTAAFVKLAREVVADFARKGIDLRGYTVKECAADVNDLRKALKYEKINLLGVSFGSQWSFAVMRMHPEIVGRALLSGVEPLDNGYDMPTDIMAAIRRSWKVAEKDKSLAPYVPAGGLEAAVKEIYKRFGEGPVTVKVKDAKSGAETAVALGKEDLQRDFLHRGPDGPAFILSLYHEHYDKWAQSVLAKRRSHADALRVIGPLIDTSLGVTPKRLEKLRGDPAVEYLGMWNWDAYVATAGVWPTADVGDDFRAPVRTDIPVLFIHGDWDTNTPVENSLEIVKSFPRGRVVIVEQGGHGILEAFAQRYSKEWGQIMDFLRKGEMPNLPERMMLPAPKFTVPDFPVPAGK
ncbi:MAG: alpha/beta hydrolase [Phycisphaerae bacterium]